MSGRAPWFSARGFERGFYFVMRLLFVLFAAFCVFLAVVVPHLWFRLAMSGFACMCLIFRYEARP